MSITADEAVAAKQGKETAPALTEAKEFLTGMIEAGRTDVEEIAKAAKAAGLGWATVRRAKDDMGIKSMRKGFRPEDGWLWKK